MSPFLLLRHAQSAWNADGRMQGWADPPLSTEGEEAARALGRALAAAGQITVSGAVSSDLQRARQTAEALLEGAGVDGRPELDARLRERDVGWVTGLDDAEAMARFPDEMTEWRSRHRDHPPGGEREASVLLRAGRALDALIAGDATRTGGAECVVVVVTHGGVLSILERAAELGPGGFANLHGRWLEEGPSLGWRLGDRFDPDGLPDGLLAGREAGGDQ